MEGIIVNYRIGRHTQNTNQMIIKVNEINDKESAKKLIDKKVSWKTPSGKEMEGIIKNIHGNNGAVRAHFKIGLPGQSIGKKVRIE